MASLTITELGDNSGEPVSVTETSLVCFNLCTDEGSYNFPAINSYADALFRIGCAGSMGEAMRTAWTEARAERASLEAH